MAEIVGAVANRAVAMLADAGMQPVISVGQGARNHACPALGLSGPPMIKRRFATARGVRHHQSSSGMAASRRTAHERWRRPDHRSCLARGGETPGGGWCCLGLHMGHGLQVRIGCHHRHPAAISSATPTGQKPCQPIWGVVTGLVATQSLADVRDRPSAPTGRHPATGSIVIVVIIRRTAPVAAAAAPPA